MFPYDAIKNQLISLVEVNSGMRDSKGFKKTLDQIYSDCVDLIKKFPNFSQLEDINKKYLTTQSSIFYYPIGSDSHMDITSSDIVLEFFPAENPIGEPEKIIFPIAGADINSSPYRIIIGLNKEATKRELLEKLDILKITLSHELVHIFKTMYGEYQRTGKEYLDAKNKINKEKYITNSGEIDAFISQLISELEAIHKKDKNITLVDALNGSLIYKKFFDEVDKVYGKHVSDDKFKDGTDKKLRKIKKHMLSKVVNFWKTEIGGKIK
jgi:hypothetical protein